jgi:gustatory receptor
MLFLSCSAIHEKSKKPLKIFRTIPSAGWHQELERFNEQVRDEDITLSGMNFYHMTKSVLFGLAGSLHHNTPNFMYSIEIFTGTLLTYELVLMQFDKVEMDPYEMIKCD